MKCISFSPWLLNNMTRRVLLTVGVLALLTCVNSFPRSHAATPSSGTITSTTIPPVTWVGEAKNGVAPNGEADCSLPSNPCDQFTLTVAGTVGDWANKRVKIQIDWTFPSDDYDLYIHKDSLTGPLVGQSAQGTTTFERFDINPSDSGVGLYVINVVYFAVATGATSPYNGNASVIIVMPPPPPPPGSCAASQYDVFPAPSTVTGWNTSGEPSIGANWNTGNVMYQSYVHTLRVSFNDSTSPAVPTWVNKRPPNAVTSLDPILFTDSVTGRTIPSQLIVVGGMSLSAVTDNDGDSYIPSPQGGGLGSGVDHQTVGGGPFKPGIPGRGPLTAYPHAVYYASQQIGYANLALSRDGGLTYEAAVPMYTLADCNGIHGHIKVAPDGTVYVPNKSCSGVAPDTTVRRQAVIVSDDNGLTWNIRRISMSTQGRSDPSLGIGAAGKIYFGYTDAGNQPRIAVSDDKGLTWHDDQEVGALEVLGINNAVFPQVVAGDNNRAAFFFLGTTGAGDGTGDDTGTPFAGTWYPFMATTCDGGVSWTTTRVGNDPVQQGVVCLNGTTCPSGTRNLLDFNDMTVDRRGRVLAAFADGCITAACKAVVNGTKTENDGTEIATIIRLRGGRGLFAAFDPPMIDRPMAPLAQATADANVNRLAWSTPYDGGSPLTGYKVYRGVLRGASRAPESLIATLSPKVNSYADSVSSNVIYYYRVTALNGVGESNANKILLQGLLNRKTEETKD